jgi:phage terminase large subunit GpA-like protein
MIDCHDKVLHYAVGAFKSDMTGNLIDYGSLPDQRRQYWTNSDAKQTLEKKYPGAGLDGALLAGVRDLLDDLLAREYVRDDGTTLRIRRCHVDVGYKTLIVMDGIRQSKYAALVMPARGIPISAAKKPFSEYEKRPGDKAGQFWRIPSKHGKGELRTVQVDVNHFKSDLFAALAIQLGDPGCFSLFEAKDGHRMLCDHLLSVYCVQTEGYGRKLDEWKDKPGKHDNHLLDCLVGLFAAASIEGCSATGKAKVRGAVAEKEQRSTTYQPRVSQALTPGVPLPPRKKSTTNYLGWM